MYFFALIYVQGEFYTIFTHSFRALSYKVRIFYDDL